MTNESLSPLIHCPKCRLKVSADRIVCERCGAALHSDVELAKIHEAAKRNAERRRQIRRIPVSQRMAMAGGGTALERANETLLLQQAMVRRDKRAWRAGKERDCPHCNRPIILDGWRRGLQ